MKEKKVCRCCAYPFPHRERGGKCADERDAQELREWQAALAVKERAAWCIVPMHKSNYILSTDRNDLKGINNKGGMVR